MKHLTTKRDLVLFLNRYANRFDELLATEEEHRTDFFQPHYHHTARAAVEFLDRETAMDFIGCCIKVISCSFTDGLFKQHLFEKAIHFYRDDLNRTIQQSSCTKQEQRIFREFIRHNFRYATFNETREWFLQPLLMDLSKISKEHDSTEHVLSIPCYKTKPKRRGNH